MKAQKLVDWVQAHVPRKLRQESGKTTLEQVLWWAAYQEASTLLETCRTKDLAHVLQAGVGPYKTLADLQRFLDAYAEDGAEAEEDMRESVRAFFEEHT